MNMTLVGDFANSKWMLNVDGVDGADANNRKVGYR